MTTAMLPGKGVSWGEQELPSQEHEEARCNLERVDYHVDHIISHCYLSSMLPQLSPDYGPDRFTKFLDEVKTKASYHYWLFGATTITKHWMNGISSCGSRWWKSNKAGINPINQAIIK